MTEDIAIMLVIAAAALGIVTLQTIKDYKLKKEQIKADIMVKTEEIKARNQIELEKLMRGEDITGYMGVDSGYMLREKRYKRISKRL